MADHAAPETPEGLVAQWHELSPVRTALYPVALAVVALLVGYGVVAEAQAGLWLALVAAVLMPAGIEVARRGAYSPATVHAIEGEWQEVAINQYANGARDALHSTPDTNAARCRDVRTGARCLLDLGHEGVHLIPTT